MMSDALIVLESRKRQMLVDNWMSTASDRSALSIVNAFCSLCSIPGTLTSNQKWERTKSRNIGKMVSVGIPDI